jgi:hypothetical protein
VSKFKSINSHVAQKTAKILKQPKLYFKNTFNEDVFKIKFIPVISNGTQYHAKIKICNFHSRP